MSQRSKNRRNKTKPASPRGTTALLERAEPLQEDRTPIPIVYEARKRSGGNAISKAFSLAWDETEAMGITADMRRSGPGMLSDQDRKETLYQAYLNSVWISACVDVIAKRITSGGMVIELTEKGSENQDEYDTLHDFLHYINEDEDFLQLIRSIATDLLIYGEAYLEIVSKAGVPFSLHKIDCATMNYKLDKHGTVVQYIQNMTHSTESVMFQPEEVIRFWLPDPKASKKALSPIERILGPVDADAHMADWVRAFFRKGARPPFWIKFPGSKEEASRFVVWLRENYTGQANAHVPMVLYDGSELQEIGKGAVDMDFSKGREMMRQEILAGYQVPPAAVSQIESGNIGGGTGESQDNSLISNACDPLKSTIFEKINYRIVQKGFKITNYRVTTQYKNLQAKSETVKTDDTRIRNGSATINEIRAETGKPPLDGGNTAVIVTTREVQPIDRLDSLSTEQEQQSQIAIGQAQAQLDMTKVQIDKAKNPPPPPPTIVQAPPQQQPAKKPVPDEKEQQQERYIFALQQSLAHTNETLARLDEQLRIAQNAHVYDEETKNFKQTLISELQWQRESELAFTEELKQEVATLRALVEALPTAKALEGIPLSVDPDEAEAYCNDTGMVMLAPCMEEERDYSEGYRSQETLYPADESSVPTTSDTQSLGYSAVVAIPENGIASTDTHPIQGATTDVQDTTHEDNRPAVVEHHTGIMIALKVDLDTATQLVIPEGEAPEDFHVTLALLTSTDEEAPEGKVHPVQTQDTLKALLSGLAATSEPLHGVVGGLARFLPSDSSDGKSPVIALVNVQGLQVWRQKLVDMLDRSGYFVAQNFDYTPHCTLAYINPYQLMPVTTIPALPLDFYGIELCIGDDVTYFPFGGQAPDETITQSPVETSAEASPTTEQAHEAEQNAHHTDLTPLTQDDEPRGIDEQDHAEGERDGSEQRTLALGSSREGTEDAHELGELAQDEPATRASGQSDSQPIQATLSFQEDDTNTTEGQRDDSRLISDETNDRIEEHIHAEQETPTQSTESDDVATRTHEDESDGTLHPVQESGDTSDSGTAESGIRDTQSESDAQQSLANGTVGESRDRNNASNHSVEEVQSLEGRITVFFESVYKRGTAALESGGTKDAYLFTESDKDALARLLAPAYLEAKVQAYQHAQETTKNVLTVKKSWVPDKKKVDTWASEQVESIASTYQELLNSQLEHITEEAIGDGVKKIVTKVKEWIHKFIPWKSKQIADNTQNVGGNEGTAQWIEDVNGGAEGDPNGVRVRVVPEDSSNDFCKEYAGNDYSLEESNDLPDFPAHPNCRHSLEVYVVDGEE